MSSSPTEISWLRLAIRDSTAIGSPCDPVQISTASSSGNLDSSSNEIKISPGIFRYPRSRATFMLRTMDRPTNAIFRLCETARSIICWIRCTWDANDATITRPFARLNTRSSTGTISFSLDTKPGTSAFVLSTIKMSTPNSPSLAKLARSVILPSRGNWSILKSPVCSTRPAGVVIPMAMASGIE